MQYIEAYFALLRETYDDVVTHFESDTSRGFFIASLVLIPVFGSFFFFAILVNAAERLDVTPSAIIQATQVDDHTIEINLTENHTPLNAVEIEFFFDPTALVVTDLAIAETLCEERFIITKDINNEAGRVFYQCGTITPFAGTSTTLATLSTLPRTAGTSTISFGTSTNALAHDGYGSNVTSSRQGGIFVSAL